MTAWQENWIFTSKLSYKWDVSLRMLQTAMGSKALILRRIAIITCHCHWDWTWTLCYLPRRIRCCPCQYCCSNLTTCELCPWNAWPALGFAGALCCCVSGFLKNPYLGGGPARSSLDLWKKWDTPYKSRRKVALAQPWHSQATAVFWRKNAQKWTLEWPQHIREI